MAQAGMPLFGGTPAQPFGQASKPNVPLFGNPNPQTSTQPPPSLFGAPTTTATAPTTSLFGGPPAPGTPLAGGQPGTGSAFGGVPFGAKMPAQPGQGGGLFGQPPAPQSAFSVPGGFSAGGQTSAFAARAPDSAFGRPFAPSPAPSTQPPFNAANAMSAFIKPPTPSPNTQEQPSGSRGGVQAPFSDVMSRLGPRVPEQQASPSIPPVQMNPNVGGPTSSAFAPPMGGQAGPFGGPPRPSMPFMQFQPPGGPRGPLLPSPQVVNQPNPSARPMFPAQSFLPGQGPTAQMGGGGGMQSAFANQQTPPAGNQNMGGFSNQAPLKFDISPADLANAHTARTIPLKSGMGGGGNGGYTGNNDYDGEVDVDGSGDEGYYHDEDEYYDHDQYDEYGEGEDYHVGPSHTDIESLRKELTEEANRWKDVANSLQQEVDALKVRVEGMDLLEQRLRQLELLVGSLPASKRQTAGQNTIVARSSLATTTLSTTEPEPTQELDLVRDFLSENGPVQSVGHEPVFVQRLALYPNKWVYYVVSCSAEKPGEGRMHRLMLSRPLRPAVEKGLRTITGIMKEIPLTGVEPAFASTWQATPQATTCAPKTAAEWARVFRCEPAEECNEFERFLWHVRIGKVAWAEYYAWVPVLMEESGDQLKSTVKNNSSSKSEEQGRFWYAEFSVKGNDTDAPKVKCVRVPGPGSETEPMDNMCGETRIFGYLQAWAMARNATGLTVWEKRNVNTNEVVWVDRNEGRGMGSEVEWEEEPFNDFVLFARSGQLVWVELVQTETVSILSYRKDGDGMKEEMCGRLSTLEGRVLKGMIGSFLKYLGSVKAVNVSRDGRSATYVWGK